MSPLIVIRFKQHIVYPMLKPDNCNVVVLSIFPYISKIILIQGFCQDEKNLNVKMASGLMVSLGSSTYKYRNTKIYKYTKIQIQNQP